MNEKVGKFWSGGIFWSGGNGGPDRV